MISAKIGSFQDLLEMTEEPLRPVANRLREIVLSCQTDACEVVRLGDRAATYGLGPRRMIDGYVYIMPYRNWINLGFYRGALLADPESLLEGTGVKLRHIKNHSLEDANRAGIPKLVQAAIKEQRGAAG